VSAAVFTKSEQQAAVELLSGGLSPAGVCRKLGRSLAEFFNTLNRDLSFRDEVQSVPTVLGQNVASALYKAALEGNVTAQTFWLRNNPPPGWKGDDADTMTDPFESMTDDELIELARTQGIALPPEVEAAIESANGEDVPRRLPQEPPADE